MVRATGDRKNVPTLTQTDLAFREFECEKVCDGKRFGFFVFLFFLILIHTFLSA